MSRRTPEDAPCATSCPLAPAPDGTRYRVEGALDRRAFVSQSLLAAAAMALAACAAGGSDGITSPTTVGATIKVSDYAALASTGGVAVVSLNGTKLAIVRTGTASFAALSLVCPHEGATISPTSTGFYCSGHGATFNASGTWIGGQRTTSMRSYATTYDATTGILSIG